MPLVHVHQGILVTYEKILSVEIGCYYYVFLPIEEVVLLSSVVVVDEDTACINHRNTSSWNIHCNSLVGIVGGVSDACHRRTLPTSNYSNRDKSLTHDIVPSLTHSNWFTVSTVSHYNHCNFTRSSVGSCCWQKYHCICHYNISEIATVLLVQLEEIVNYMTV